MRPQGILETSLYVDDLDAAQAFYGDVLGLELHGRVEGRHVFFRCGDGMLLLFDPEATSRPAGMTPAHGARGPGHVAFSVEAGDLGRWRDRITAAGVAIEAELTWPTGVRSIYFRDPAGNSLEIGSPEIWGSVG
jgi:catechol 2,3-dioxygenase-like lactoylglutathione lyase family enzyme